MTYVLGHNIECPTSFWWIIIVSYNITNLYLTRKQWNWLENRDLIDVARWYSSRTFYTPSQGVIQNLFWNLRFTHIFERKTMNSHCLIILSLMFPLHSISAQASSCNEGCSLIQTGRRIIAWHADSNMKHMVPQMHVTSIESSNSEATIDLRSWRGHKNRHHRRHLRNVRSAIS